MLEQTAAYIRSRITPRLPQTLIILGSGLGSLGEKLENAVSLDYKDIPDFPQSTVKGHGGRLICGKLGSRKSCACRGVFICTKDTIRRLSTGFSACSSCSAFPS